MLPKYFLTHFNTKMATRHQRLFCTFPVVLMSLLLLVLQQSIVSSAEKDFNFNDSQVPLIEPKDEQPILIDTHHLSSTIHKEQQSHSIHHQHTNHHVQQQPHHHQHQQHLHHEEQDPYAVELSHCRYGDNEIVLSLVLKSYNWHDFNDSRKAKVLEKLSKFFAISKEFIAMESVTKHELYEMQKVALKKGNNKCHNNNRKLGRVSFIIGCGSTYFTVSEPITKQIGEQFKNGALDNITGEKFGWWIIWNKQYKTRTQRNRRQIEGSGDDDEDEEYDYDEDYVDETVVTTSTTASSHAHRHHHGDETDETTLEPENTQDLLSKASSTTPQSIEESSAIASATATATSTTTTLTSTTPAPILDIQSSTTALPDYVEPKIENTPPMIKNRINKLAVTAGKSFRYLIPKDTFYDNEDLSNLRLGLANENGHELKSNSWLQFNAESREIYGLPLEDAVSKWSYRLTATDSGNESVTEIVEISVQQHRYVRSVNHEINISVKINEKSMHFIDWPLKLIEAIAETLGDSDANALVVREIRTSPQDPNTATLVYFNETFPNNVCPERVELTNLIKRLDVSRLNDLVQPTLGIKQLTGQLIGNCKETDDIKPKTPTIHIKNVNPVPRNQIDRINATMGHLLVYKVPSDTFFDSNDNELRLSLKTKDHKEISPRHWLQFDSKNEEFYGIPKSGDIGDEEYQLVAEDAGGLTANDALVVVVYPAPKKDFSVYIKFYLAIRHELFNADLQRKFVERIALLFGDATTQNIQIRSINPHHDFDGTIVNIYNTTLFKAHNRCPEEEMEMLRNVYLHDDTVRERVKKTLGSELNVTKVQVITSASCNAQTDVTHREFIPTKTEEPLFKSTFPEDYLYTILLPAAIIIVMILVALLIACCLHRRRRKSGKMELGDEEERKSFRTKGIPVIFQDELDEKPEIGNKSPIILKDEKPPLLPPSYNTSNMNGDNDVDEYVPPPAVVVGGREARGKSPATPSYRKPPPYVSP